MHFTWEQHQKLSRNVAKVADKDMGLAISLIGVALMLLSKDLLLVDQQLLHSEINKKVITRSRSYFLLIIFSYCELIEMIIGSFRSIPLIHCAYSVRLRKLFLSSTF